MVLLDGRRDDAGNANTIAAHFHYRSLAVFIQNRGVHGLAVLVAQLENVANFNTATDLQCAVTIRAGIALDHITKIFHPADFGIAFPVYASQVIIILVGAADKICQVCCAAIHDNRHRQLDRADGAWLAADGFFDFLVGCHGQRLGNAGKVLSLDLIQGVIAAQNQGHQAGFTILIRLCLYQQCFHTALSRHAQELGNSVDGSLTRGMNLFQFLAGGRALAGRCYRFGFFDVGGVVTAGTEYDGVFARGG